MKLDYMLDHMPESIRQHSTRRTFQPGEIVVRKGDRADHVYLIMAGNLLLVLPMLLIVLYSFMTQGNTIIPFTFTFENYI